MKAVRMIVPKNGMFHIGKASLTESKALVNSDTLFSALCNNIRMLYGLKKLDEMKEYLVNEFLISSVFHFIDLYQIEGDKSKLVDTIYFLPKPLKTPNVKQIDKKYFDEQLKNWKEIQFISKEVLEQIIEGKAINFNSRLILDDKYLISDKDYKLLEFDKLPDSLIEIVKDQIRITQELTEQKVLISRLNFESKDTFHQGNLLFTESNYYIVNRNTRERTYFTLKPGMFFLIKNEKLPKEVIAAIRLIVDTGLGGKRTTGKGLFNDCQIIEFNLSLVDEITPPMEFVTFSVVIPQKQEISSLKHYTLTTKRGFMFSKNSRSLRKRTIVVLNEGSLFDSEIKGKVIDVSPKEMRAHEVFRYGKAFLLPMKKY